MPTPPFSHAQCYQTLHLDPRKSYTASGLRHAYLRRAKAVHPDKHPDNPDATRLFQEVSRAYTTLCQWDTEGEAYGGGGYGMNDWDGGATEAEEAGDIDTNIDLDKYRHIYETLSSTLAEKATVFWETSTEAKVLKKLWQSWRGDAAETDTGDDSDTYTSTDTSYRGNGNTHTTSSEPDTDTSDADTSDADTSDADTSDTDIRDTDIRDTDIRDTDIRDTPPPIRIPLTLPLHDVYHNIPHKVHYTRYRWSVESNTPEPEEQTVLVRAGCRQMTCYGEGDLLTEYGAAGDVVFDIEPMMPSDRYRMDLGQMVLVRLVALTPDEICYGTRATATREGGEGGEKVIEVCGEEVSIRVLPGLHTRWGKCDGNVMVVAGRGLIEDDGWGYDAEEGGDGGDGGDDGDDGDDGSEVADEKAGTRGALHIVFDVVPP